MSERDLSIEAAAELPAGSDHYRAYVGPPERYGLIGLSQLALLQQLGLRETDRVLDFGCGSLRLGRMLIPFLREGGYFGIEPNMWLVDEGFARELGDDARRLKRPEFSADASFDCTVFGCAFHYIIAQSIITHSGWRETQRLFESAARALEPGGVFVFSYLENRTDQSLPEAPWIYPFNVAYPTPWLEALARDQGLVWEPSSWPHPGATWAAARRPA